MQEGAAMRCLSLFLVMCRVPLPDLPTPPFLTLPSQDFYPTNLMSLSRPTRKQSEEPAMSRRAWNYKYYINGRSSICSLYSSWARNLLAKTICVLYTLYDLPHNVLLDSFGAHSLTRRYKLRVHTCQKKWKENLFYSTIYWNLCFLQTDPVNLGRV